MVEDYIMYLGFNPRLREEATAKANRELRSELVSIHASVKRRLAFSGIYGSYVQFQSTPP